jgi:hypothetical protein
VSSGNTIVKAYNESIASFVLSMIFTPDRETKCLLEFICDANSLLASIEYTDLIDTWSPSDVLLVFAKPDYIISNFSDPTLSI